MAYFNIETFKDWMLNIRGFKLSTFNNSITTIKRIVKNIYPDNKNLEELKITDLEDDKDKILYFIVNNIKSDGVKCVLLNTILNILRCFQGEVNPITFLTYQNLYKKTTLKSNEDRILNVNKQELKNMITFDDVKTAREKFKEKLREKYVPHLDLTYLILCLYSMFIPLRQQDYINTLLYFNKSNEKKRKKGDKVNYLDLHTKTLHILDHKRANGYGKKLIVLPDDLIYIIKDLRLKINSKWLLPSPMDKEKPMLPSTFTHLLNSALHKKVSSSMLRKIYISNLKNNNVGLDELKKTARIMGHSLATSLLIYGKFNSEQLNKK